MVQIYNHHTNSKLPQHDVTITANDFNKYFTTITDEIITKIPINSNKNAERYLTERNDVIPPASTIFLSPVTPKDILDVIKKLKNKKSEDIYGMHVEIIKLVADEIAKPLTDLINICLCQGIFPDSLKKAKVIPVFKKGDDKLETNYRPISLLPCFAKIFEKIIFQKLKSFFDKNNIFSGCQYGFRTNKSTEDAVTAFVEEVHEAWENFESVIGTFIDLSKAFDCVNHEILLKKLEYYGIKGPALALIKSYLYNRTQQVFFKGKYSEEMPVKRGVPQGSILGPLLFIIFINDLPSCLPVPSVLYADDTNFLVRGKSLQIMKQTSNAVLQEAKNWFNANQLYLNQSKTEEKMFFPLGHNDGGAVKFLGVQVDSNLNWSEHINYLCKNLCGAIYAIRKIRNSVGESAAMTAYYALFYSKIKYCVSVWGAAAKCHLERVFLLQKMAVRAIAQVSSKTSCRTIFLKYGIMTIYALICLEKICATKKNLENEIINADCHSYNTRKRQNIRLPKHRLQKSKQMCLGKKLFNCLPDHYKRLELNKLRKQLKYDLIQACLYKIEDFHCSYFYFKC